MKFMKFIVIMKTVTKIEFNEVEVNLRFSCCYDFYWSKNRAMLPLFVMKLTQIELVVKII